MSQEATAAKVLVETPEQKLARLEAENAQLKRLSAPQAATGPTPKTIEAVIDGTTFIATHRTFASGSVGFYANGKIKLADGKRYTIGLTMVEIGSKPTK